MSGRPTPTLKSRYPHTLRIATRWADNDAYGHVNNVIYYSLFDTAVARHLMDNRLLDIADSTVIAFVAETRCTYFSSVAFPDELEIGLKVVKLGNSAVTYEIGLFRVQDERASALGLFTHVYVDRATGRPTAIPPEVRRVLSTLAA